MEKKTEKVFEESMGVSYFYSLVHPRAERKKRPCLKCNVHFVSRSVGNRICSSCAEQNSRKNINAVNF